MSEWSMPGVDEWTVPGYTEERLLGRGVSGRVVAAVNDATGQRVAIKYLDDDLVIRDDRVPAGISVPSRAADVA